MSEMGSQRSDKQDRFSSGLTIAERLLSCGTLREWRIVVQTHNCALIGCCGDLGSLAKPFHRKLGMPTNTTSTEK